MWGAHTTVALLPVLSVGLCSRILSRSSRFLSIGQVCIECGGSAEHIVGCADVIALELEYAVESSRKIGPILEGEPISNKRAHARDFRMRERVEVCVSTHPAAPIPLGPMPLRPMPPLGPIPLSPIPLGPFPLVPMPLRPSAVAADVADLGCWKDTASHALSGGPVQAEPRHSVHTCARAAAASGAAVFALQAGGRCFASRYLAPSLTAPFECVSTGGYPGGP